MSTLPKLQKPVSTNNWRTKLNQHMRFIKGEKPLPEKKPSSRHCANYGSMVCLRCSHCWRHDPEA